MSPPPHWECMVGGHDEHCCYMKGSHYVPPPSHPFQALFPLFPCSWVIVGLVSVVRLFVHRPTTRAEQWEQRLSAPYLPLWRGNRRRTYAEQPGNRLIIYPCDSAIPGASRDAPGSAPNPEPGGSVRHGSYQSASTKLAPSGVISPVPR